VPRVRQRRLAGGVTGLEESLWPFALQQGVSAGRASGGRVLQNFWLVPLMVGGRCAGRDYRVFTKVENKRFDGHVNVLFFDQDMIICTYATAVSADATTRSKNVAL
jgi:hypothetical protein